MTNRMAVAMALAMANRMAKLMRFGWQNYAPNPNPNPNTSSSPLHSSKSNLAFASPAHQLLDLEQR